MKEISGWHLELLSDRLLLDLAEQKVILQEGRVILCLGVGARNYFLCYFLCSCFWYNSNLYYTDTLGAVNKGRNFFALAVLYEENTYVRTYYERHFQFFSAPGAKLTGRWTFTFEREKSLCTQRLFCARLLEPRSGFTRYTIFSRLQNNQRIPKSHSVLKVQRDVLRKHGSRGV